MQILTFTGGCLIGYICGIVSTLGAILIGMCIKGANEYFDSFTENDLH